MTPGTSGGEDGDEVRPGASTTTLGGVVIDPGPSINRMASIDEKDLTCFGYVSVNELFFVYVALLCASIARPVSIISCLYFVFLLVATPLYSYCRWFSVQARKRACLSIAIVSGALLIVQVAMVLLWVFDHNQDAKSTLEMFSIDSQNHVSYSLFSFLARDLGVFVASIIAVGVLRAKEEERMTHRGTPAQLTGQESILTCHWRMLALALLVLSSVVYPSLLSMPFYLIYLATISFWSLGLFLPTKLPDGTTRDSRFARIWELGLARLGAVYTGGYLLLTYIFQIPAVAAMVDLEVIRNYGAMNVLQTPNTTKVKVAVFILHTIAVFLLYVVSSSVLVAHATASSPSQPQPQQQAEEEPPRKRTLTPSDLPVISSTSPQLTPPHSTSHTPNGSRLMSLDLTESINERTSATSSPGPHALSLEDLQRRLSMDTTTPTPPRSPAAVAAAGSGIALSSALPASSHRNQTQALAQRLVAYYGLYLCFLVYIILALQRPTILGFVFMVFVMIGAVLPDFVFRSCAPVLLIYTVGYAACVYCFGSVVIRNDYLLSEPHQLITIGLPPIDPFTDGWLVAGIPLYMTTLLGLAWHYRAEAKTGAGIGLSTSSSSQGQGDIFNVLFGYSEWRTYLERYLILHDIGIYVCVNLCFAVGFSRLDAWHFPFVFLASTILAFPSFGPYLWTLVVAYAQAFILIQYWHQYKYISDQTKDRPFGALMALPVIFFVFACRQLAVYVTAWRKRRAGNEQGTAALRPNSLKRPSSARVRAASVVNVSLYLAKVFTRLALLALLWHMAFHTPLSVFAVGYLALLSTLPLVFVWSGSYRHTSRRDFPRVFRAISVYAGIVLCLLHLFCSKNLTGIALEEQIGAQVQHYGRTFIILNWVLQLLCAAQTEVLRKQELNMAKNLKSYPYFVHALKQILPFVLLTVIFAFTWEYISFFGAVILYLGIVNAVLGRKIETIWRFMLILSIIISLSIVIFDLAAFGKFTSPTLFWLGLRRGNYIPDPDAPANEGLPQEAEGWQLSASAEAYLVIAFLAALQFFYNTGENDGISMVGRVIVQDTRSSYPSAPSGAGGEGGIAFDLPDKAAAAAAAAADGTPTRPLSNRSDVSNNSETTSPRQPGVIDNTHVLAPSITSLIEIIYRGKITKEEQKKEAESTSKGHKKGASTMGSTTSTASTSKSPFRRAFRLAVLQQVLADIYGTFHGVLLSCLSTAMMFSFELCVIFVIIAATMHAGLISFLYLALFVFLTTRPRVFIHDRWHYVVYGLGLLIMAEYLVLLRLPPHLEASKGAVAKVMGSRQCSIFARYTDEEAADYPYSYGQWLGLCMTDEVIILIDFIVLLLVIIQAKRFKSYHSEPEKVVMPLFAHLIFETPDPEHPPEPDPTMSLARYLVIRYGAYLIVLTIFILSTLTFNLLSLGYILLVAMMVGNHAQEGVFTRRRFMWSSIAFYAWCCLSLRILFQVPVWTPEVDTSSFEILLGLRKVYATSSSPSEYPPEMAFDTAILILIVMQRRVFLSPDFKRFFDELWYAEQYDYIAHGCHVVNQLEKIREEAMITIRTQIRTMYEQLETVARARMEEASGNKSWEHFLLKNRNTAAMTAKELNLSSSMPEGLELDDTQSLDGIKLPTDDDQEVLTFQAEQQQQNPMVQARAGEEEQDPLLLRDRASSSHSNLRSIRTLSLSTTEPLRPKHRLSSPLPPIIGRSGSRAMSYTGNPSTSEASEVNEIRRNSYSPRPTRGRSIMDATQGLTTISTWVSGAIQQSKILNIKDPLELNDEQELVVTTPRSSTDLSHSNSNSSLRSTAAVLGVRGHRGPNYSPVFADMGEDPDLAEANEEDSDESTGAATNAAATAADSRPLPFLVNERSTPQRRSSLAQFKEQGKESSANESRARRIGLQILQNLFLLLNSRSTSLVYSVLVAAHMYEPALLNLIYPVSVFGYALLQNPRSLPRIGGSLVHPMIQNPPRLYWNFLLLYSFVMLVIKFVFQFPLFCVCANHFSMGETCPSSLMAFKDVCEEKGYPHLDYFIDQPIVKDYFVGLFKAYRSLSWNQMSIRYEPVNRYVPPDAPGMTSDTILDSGLGGAFLVSFLGDFMVLVAVLWHTHVLKIRGVWLSRDPDFLSTVEEDKVEKIKQRSSRTLTKEELMSTARSRASPSGCSSTTSAATPLPLPSHSPAQSETSFTSAGGVGGGGRPSGHYYHDSNGSSSQVSDTDSINIDMLRHHIPMTPKESLQKQKHKEEDSKEAAPVGMFREALREFCMVFTPHLQARAKPGCDLYVSLFFIQCLLFVFVLLSYQQAEHLVQSVRENQLSGGFILVMLMHFVLIVIDRCLYLHRSIRGKIMLQMVLIACVFFLIHSDFTFRIGINQHGPVFAWYLILCSYLFVSALQISYGYPPFIQTNWMTKRVHHAWGNVFRIYRAIPFLYELRMMLDWTCTPTTLYLGEWMKLEDIFSGLYITECNLHFQEVEQRKKGDRQPLRRKWCTGFLIFVLLNLLVWLPLFLFSTGSLSNYDNFVETGSLSVQLNGFPVLYEAASADYISPLLPQDTWSSLAQGQPALAILPATSTNDYMKELQFVRMPRASQELWKISPPAEAELLNVLEGNRRQPATSPSHTQILNADGIPVIGDNPTTLADNTPTVPSSSYDSPVGLTLQFTFKTQDSSINVGSTVHLLSEMEKWEMAQVIRGNGTSVRLKGVMPSVIRISATKEVTPLVPNDVRADCVLSFNKLAGASGSTNGTTTTKPVAALADSSSNIDTTTGWWDLTCGSAALGCNTAEEPAGQAAATIGVGNDGQPEPGCDPSLFSISSQKTIGSYFSFGYGIIGLYFTVVFTIGRFVHMSVMNMKYNIICDDLPRVEVIKELCMTIYLARMYKNLALEEELYRELIDIYRRPQYLYTRTGPYLHWIVNEDDETNSYEKIVEKELAKYK